MKPFLIIVITALLLLSAPLALGAPCGPNADGSSYTLCVDIPGVEPTQTDFAGFLAQLYRLALILGGTAVFARVVYGGIMYTISGGVVNKQKEAQEIFTNAAWGGGLLLASYLILKTINPALVVISVPSIDSYARKAHVDQQNLDMAHGNLLLREESRKLKGMQSATSDQERRTRKQDHLQFQINVNQEQIEHLESFPPETVSKKFLNGLYKERDRLRGEKRRLSQ